MYKSPKEKCKTCKHFAEPDETDEGDSENPIFVGECRRYPPSIKSSQQNTNAVFPLVYDFYWCGEWKENESAN